ncbi:signal peptidase I [Paraglaciecola aquimarina]|uniref:Signal peptidase I n=1 Tax=Paraglaciecola aquimarina TaxID=1235557 RepID=A0ABU3T109_9ALTE|nr:signal peptidase I [Paraglaciecola aquimarina]MDU0355907.1 signal peptidase I [Paraglaciecola aquimarina]
MTLNLRSFVKQNWTFIVFALVLFTSRSSFADWYLVPTGSMQPTIVEGDRILVDKLAYRLELPFTDIAIMQTGQPKRGDIVVFNSQKADTRLVKRLIGESGDTVAMHNNRLVINGIESQYEFTENTYKAFESLSGTAHLVQFVPIPNAANNFAEVRVPAGHYLVLGDNRNNSSDSRYIGFVPEQEIQGKALKVLVSLDANNYYLPRGERFFKDLI